MVKDLVKVKCPYCGYTWLSNSLDKDTRCMYHGCDIKFDWDQNVVNETKED